MASFSNLMGRDRRTVAKKTTAANTSPTGKIEAEIRAAMLIAAEDGTADEYLSDSDMSGFLDVMARAGAQKHTILEWRVHLRRNDLVIKRFGHYAKLCLDRGISVPSPTYDALSERRRTEVLGMGRLPMEHDVFQGKAPPALSEIDCTIPFSWCRPDVLVTTGEHSNAEIEKSIRSAFCKTPHELEAFRAVPQVCVLLAERCLRMRCTECSRKNRIQSNGPPIVDRPGREMTGVNGFSLYGAYVPASSLVAFTSLIRMGAGSISLHQPPHTCCTWLGTRRTSQETHRQFKVLRAATCASHLAPRVGAGTKMQHAMLQKTVLALGGEAYVRVVRENVGVDVTEDGLAAASIDAELEALVDIVLPLGRTPISKGTRIIVELKYGVCGRRPE